MAYNSDRKGYETKDGGLIRINSSGDKVRIDVYDGNQREKGGHTRDSINYDTNTGKGVLIRIIRINQIVHQKMLAAS